jgi:hypothetical protein
MDTMRVYEEYDTPQEKRQAQIGASRGKPTGKARGYMFTFQYRGEIQAFAPVFKLEPGAGIPRAAGGGVFVCGCQPSHDYIRQNCRAVGLCHLPDDWRAFGEDLKTQ